MDTIEDYRLKLKKIADFAFGYGIDTILNEQFKLGNFDKLEKSILEKFYVVCHDGFKIAQKLIIEEIMQYQTFLRDSTIELKEYRRQQNKEKEESSQIKIRIIEQRLYNFSHIADGIAWLLIGGQIHIVRRLYIQEKSSKYLDSSNIEHAIKVAEKINENPNDFALISDLTGFIQIGDLLVRHNNFIEIIELKEGKINHEIKQFFESIEKTEKKITEEDLEKKFDTTTIKQIKRMQRQKERAFNATNIINNDKGQDPVTGANIIIGTPNISTEYYHKELSKLYDDLKNKIWAYTVIDRCLHIGMYRDEGIRMAPFIIKQLLKEETMNYIVIDWLSITHNLSEPLFCKPFPPEFIIDILTGKIKIIIGLNIDMLIYSFNVLGLKTKWLTEKETMKNKQSENRKEIFICNKRGIVSTLSNGQDLIISGGIISKILYDSIKPKNIAETILSLDCF